MSPILQPIVDVNSFFTGEAQNSKEACELVEHPIVTAGEWEQKEKLTEKIGMWGTTPLKGTNSKEK
jgi:hypothetical protein